MTSQDIESAGSKAFRRGAGWLGLAGLFIAIFAGLWGSSRVATTGLITFLAVPWLTFIGHISFTRCLTPDEKRVWHAEMWVSYRSVVALWSYLFATNLKKRTAGFAPYKGGYDRAV